MSKEQGKLTLTRRVGESLMIGHDISVQVLEVNGNQARLGIDAPKEIEVHREEIYQRINAENENSCPHVKSNKSQPLITVKKRRSYSELA